MPDLRSWNLGHSELRLRFDQLCLEYLSFMTITRAKPQLPSWYSEKQVSITIEILKEDLLPRWKECPDLLFFSPLLAAEASEMILGFLVSRLRSSTGPKDPDERLQDYAMYLARIWDTSSKPEKPAGAYLSSTWRNTLERFLQWTYVDYFLSTVDTISLENDKDFNEVIRNVLRNIVTNITTSIATKVLRGESVFNANNNHLADEVVEAIEIVELPDNGQIEVFSKLLMSILRKAGINSDLLGATGDDLGWMINSVEKGFIGWIL